MDKSQRGRRNQLTAGLPNWRSLGSTGDGVRSLVYSEDTWVWASSCRPHQFFSSDLQKFILQICSVEWQARLLQSQNTQRMLGPLFAVRLWAIQLAGCFRERKQENAADEPLGLVRRRELQIWLCSSLSVIGWLWIGRANLMGSVLGPIKASTI